MPSDTEDYESAISQPSVVKKHQLRAAKTRPMPYGKKVLVWQCIGCGTQTKSKSKLGECEDPTKWVDMGCPKDGLGHCRDCGARFAFEYPEATDEVSVIEMECPECGSIDWERRDQYLDSTGEKAVTDGGVDQSEAAIERPGVDTIATDLTTFVASCCTLELDIRKDRLSGAMASAVWVVCPGCGSTVLGRRRGSPQLAYEGPTPDWAPGGNR